MSLSLSYISRPEVTLSLRGRRPLCAVSRRGREPTYLLITAKLISSTQLRQSGDKGRLSCLLFALIPYLNGRLLGEAVNAVATYGRLWLTKGLTHGHFHSIPRQDTIMALEVFKTALRNYVVES